MARIIEFFEVPGAGKIHPTEVECGYSTAVVDGQTYLELKTYGSDKRASTKKVSQALQFDREAAAQVLALIHNTFPELRRDEPGDGRQQAASGGQDAKTQKGSYETWLPPARRGT